MTKKITEIRNGAKAIDLLQCKIEGLDKSKSAIEAQKTEAELNPTWREELISKYKEFNIQCNARGQGIFREYGSLLNETVTLRKEAKTQAEKERERKAAGDQRVKALLASSGKGERRNSDDSCSPLAEDRSERSLKRASHEKSSSLRKELKKKKKRRADKEKKQGTRFRFLRRKSRAL